MNPDLLKLITAADALFLGGLAFFYVVLPIIAARDGIVHWFKRGTVGTVVFLIIRVILIQRGFQPFPAFAFAIVGGWLAAVVLIRPRSRYIPTRVRRRVIARDLKGAKFDGRKHAIDHRYPFSKGGSHTEDNLRVVSKKENLRKGAKHPKPKDWF